MSGPATLKRYSLHRRARLRDGTPILVRTLRTGTARSLQRGFARLSACSRRFPLPVPSAQAQPRTGPPADRGGPVQPRGHRARDESRPDHPGIGVARFVRLEQDPGVAEFAITVIDEYQNRGLGTLLLKLLLKAAQSLQVRTTARLPAGRQPGHAPPAAQVRGHLAPGLDNTLTVDLPVPLPAS